MNDFKSIPELPVKKSIFPDWVASFCQKWLIVIGIIITILACVFNNYDVLDDDAGFAILMAGVALTLFGIFCNWWSLGSDGRETKIWLNQDNTYDAVTPRAYSKLCDTWFHRIAYIRNKNALKYFAVADKEIFVETKDGSTFSAPISEIATMYTIIKGKSNESTTTKFNLSANGQSISFYCIVGMLEKEEWEDIFNLLYRSKSFEETKGSKLLGKVQSAISMTSDLMSESSWTDEALDKLKDSAEKATQMKLHGTLKPIK